MPPNPISRAWSTTPPVAKAAPPLYAYADRLQPQIKTAFLNALDTLRRRLTGPQLQALLEAQDLDALRRLGLWDEFEKQLTAELQQPISDLIQRGGQDAISNMPESVQLQLRFDLTNPYAVAAIQTEVAASVRQLVNASQQAVLTVLREAYTDGIDAGTTARRLRTHLGLTDRDARALEAYRNGLAQQNVAAGRLEDLANGYAARLIRQRASAIARTETIRAANLGTQGAWQAATLDGLLDPGQRRIWIVTPDDRLCPLCEGVPDLNPDGVGLGQPFNTDLGPVMNPPLHVQCRCTQGLTEAS